MRKNPLVSIITVVYNGVATIERTIQSVINQTYKKIEYIIIDGDSTDGTKDIVNSYIDKISFFVSEKDAGLYDAMNKGILHASGDIVGIINSDDWYALDAVEQIVETFCTNDNVGVVYGRVVNITKSGEQILKEKVPSDRIWHRMLAPHPTVFVSKGIYDEYGLFDLNYKIAADYELLLRFYVNKICFKYVDSVLAYFSEGGISQQKNFLCAKEYYKAAFAHSKNQCNAIKIQHELRDGWAGWVGFEGDLQEHPNIIKNIFEAYFKTRISKIVIFGIGEWGEKCYNAIVNANVDVDFFVDNRSGEIQQKFGKAVKNPEKLTCEDYILVAVRSKADEVILQLKKMNITRYLSISAIKNIYAQNKWE